MEVGVESARTRFCMVCKGPVHCLVLRGHQAFSMFPLLAQGHQLLLHSLTVKSGDPEVIGVHIALCSNEKEDNEHELAACMLVVVRDE